MPLKAMIPQLLRVLPTLELVEEERIRNLLEREAVSTRSTREWRNAARREKWGLGHFTSVKCRGLDATFIEATGEMLVLMPWTDQNPELPNPLTQEQYLAKAKLVLASLPPIKHDTVRVEFYPGGEEDRLYLIFQVAGRDCTNVASFAFHRKNGCIRSVRVEERSDPTKFGRAPILSKEVCRQAAWEAYFRFHPHAQTVILEDGVLEVGRLNLADLLLANEVPRALAASWEARYSTPYFRFTFGPVGTGGSGWGSIQRVYVDARTGRALAIGHYLVPANKPTEDPEPLDRCLPVTARNTRGHAERVEGVEVCGLPVHVESKGISYSARYSCERNLLFVPWGKSWYTYRPEPKLAATLARMATVPKPFGATR